MLKSIALAAALILPAACATAPVDSALAAATEPDKTSCRYEAVTGSRLKEKTCRTNADWAAFDAARQAELEDELARAGANSNSYGEAPSGFGN